MSKDIKVTRERSVFNLLTEEESCMQKDKKSITITADVSYRTIYFKTLI